MSYTRTATSAGVIFLAFACGCTSPVSDPLKSTSSRSTAGDGCVRDDVFFLFMRGCINDPPGACVTDDPGFFAEYIGVVHDAYDAAHGNDDGYTQWEKKHVRIGAVRLADSGEVDRQLQAIADGSGSSRPQVHLYGHSAGGAAIMKYLYENAYGADRLPVGILSAATNDSPLGGCLTRLPCQDGILAAAIGFTRYDDAGDRYAAWRADGTEITTFDLKSDWVNHLPMPGTDSYEFWGNPGDPNYPGLENEPRLPNGMVVPGDAHAWTFQHVGIAQRTLFTRLWNLRAPAKGGA